MFMCHLYVCRLLETDKRALTRITSTNSMVDGVEQKNIEHQKSTDSKTDSVERKSSGSIADNAEFTPDSPSMPRRPSIEEMWYVPVTKCYQCSSLNQCLQ